jgi:hypothetical protein
LIFRSDPTVSVADEIEEEFDLPIDIGDSINPDFTSTPSESAKGWDETWLSLEDEADTVIDVA